MGNDFLEDDSTTEENWDEFKVEPEVGDLKILNDLVKRAAEIKAGITKLETRTEQGKSLFKDLMEVQIPQKMERCGFAVGDTVSYGGIKVELKSDTYANVPSISAINDEKDEKKRQELIDRRAAGLAILEEMAPTLIKRKFDIAIDREQPEQAQLVKNLLEEMEDPPEWTEGLNVHPATLSKWVREKKSTAYAFTPHQEWAFGLFPKKVAKITK